MLHPVTPTEAARSLSGTKIAGGSGKGETEGGREGGREGESEGQRKGVKERGREGKREGGKGVLMCLSSDSSFILASFMSGLKIPKH